jgi:hypothetical protein
VSFQSVYRVSPRNSYPSEEDINSLSRALGMELPIGYREYATSLGHGAMCTFLIVKPPNQVGPPVSKDEEFYRGVFAQESESDSDVRNVAGLDSTDFQHATVFAYASAEAPIWFATRTQGQRLFEYVKGDTFEIENGFFGLVERCAAEQEHEFPFFEPNNGRRRMRQLYVRPGVGRAGFFEAMARRWGSDSLRCSRSSKDERYPHYFVPAIEGHIELHLDPEYNRLPGDSFFVRACYDMESEADLAAFVEPLLLPGGGPHEYTGEPIWLR